MNSPANRSRRRIAYLSMSEWVSFMAAITSPRDRALFTVIYWRGLRASEPSLLTMGHLDFNRGIIRVERLKGSCGGEYMLSPAEKEELQAWLQVRGSKPGPLFPARGGKPIKRGQIFLLFRRYATDAGVAEWKRRVHSLKHSIATHLLDKGVAITAVQDWLGHKNIANTMVYASVTNAQRREAERIAYA